MLLILTLSAMVLKYGTKNGEETKELQLKKFTVNVYLQHRVFIAV